MRNLIIPEIEPKEIYNNTKQKARSPEKKQILENLETYIFDRYKEYEMYSSELEKISESSIKGKNEKDALLSCYNRNKDGYLEGEVVTNIIQSQSKQHRNNCPYCGLDKPRTIDHYLPKGEFPEFSFYPLNLIPCCNYCNQKKSSRWKEDGKRTFINLYFDEVPEKEQFLFLDLKYIGSENAPYISFEIKNPDQIDSDLYELIKGHYESLELLKEFSEKIEEEISNINDLIRSYRDIPIQVHQQTIKQKFCIYKKNYGLNHWKTVLYQNLSSNNEFFIESLRSSS